MTPVESSIAPNSAPPTRKSAHWLRRLGLAGFAFFFVKGLLWLIVPVLIARSVLAPAASGTPASNQAAEQD